MTTNADAQGRAHTCSCHVEVTFENGLNLTPNWPLENCIENISKEQAGATR